MLALEREKVLPPASLHHKWSNGQCARSQASNLLDKLNHLTLFDSSGIILVELTEALIEVFVIESGAVRHVRKRISDELLGLVFVEVTIAVRIVLGPDFVHTLGDDVVDFGIS